MSDLVGNPEDGFSHNEAHIKVGCKGVFITQTSYHDCSAGEGGDIEVRLLIELLGD